MWPQRMKYGTGLLANLAHTAQALRVDPDFNDLFWFDEMQQRPVMSRVDPGIVTDVKLVMLQETLQDRGLKRLSLETLQNAILLVSQDHRFHPIKERLERVQWDQQLRTGMFLTTYFGCPDSDYCRVVSSCFLVSLIARLYKPGCKADYMLVLEGPQGELKSTACRILAGEEFFSDTMPDLAADQIRSSQHLRGKWLIEISELSATSRAEPHRLKSFISTQTERYLPKFGRAEVVEPRQCIFVGTTNDDRYLRDDTGGRRFWPAKCGRIDIEALERDRDQILAEALDAYKNGAHWWPDRGFELQYIKPVQDSRYQSDAWEDAIADWATHCPKTGTNLIGIAINALGFERTARIGTHDQNRMKACLNRLEWVRGSRQSGGNVWFPPAPKI